MQKKSFLQKLGHFILSYPKAILIASLALTFVSLVYTAFFLKLDCNQDNLISGKLAYHQRYQDFLNQFGDSEYFYVVFEVKPGKEEQAKSLARELSTSLEGHNELFTEVSYKIEIESLKNRFFLLLPDAQFDSMTEKLNAWNSEINQVASLNSFESLFAYINTQINSPLAELKNNADVFEKSFPLFIRLLHNLDKPDEIKNWQAASLFAPLVDSDSYQDPDGYFFTGNGRLMFVRVMPVKDYSTTKIVEKPLEFLRDKIEIIKKKNPSVKIGLTGRPVLQADEMESTGNDSIWASIVSLLGVLALYIYYLRDLKRPLLIITALVCGMSWTAGFITLTLGHLNLLTVVFAIILIGLGVDYGMHYLLRYLKDRETNDVYNNAFSKSLASVGGGIITGAITTAAAFYSALFSDFLGLNELGFIAGSGVFFCLVSQLVTFPALLVLTDRDDKFKFLNHEFMQKISKRISKEKDGSFVVPKFTWLDWTLQNPKIILGFISVFTILLFPFSLSLNFDNNILKLQDQTLESVAYEQKIIREADTSTWFAAMTTNNLDDLKELEKKSQNLGTVKQVESILSVVPVHQQEKIAALNALHDKYRSLSIPPISTNVNAQLLSEELSRMQNRLSELSVLALTNGEKDAVETIDDLVADIRDVNFRLRKNPEETSKKIVQSQKYFFGLLDDAVTGLVANLQPKPISEGDLPPDLLKRYKSAKGNYVLYLYPMKNIWDAQYMEEFISDLRGLDPEVTGAPITVYESSTRMKAGFYLVGLITSVFVVLFLFIEFRSIRDALVASLPLAIGILWLTAWMHFFDIALNLANFFALPILIGIGIDNGVHLVHRYHETHDPKDVLQTVAPAIILSTLTTFIGFGSLSFVRHQGLSSFGKIMSLGSLSCLFSALLIIPLFYQGFDKHKPKKHR